MSKFSEIDQIENQFILRCTEDMANDLNRYFESKTEQQPDLSIQAKIVKEGEAERVILQIELDGVVRKASILQLPTISETFKTVDRVNFFKSNDISEMIYVHEQGDIEVPPELARKTIEIKKSVSEPKRLVKFKAHSGITPPTQYIRQKFFRKKPQIPSDKLQEVQSQLQRIRQDIVAIPRSGEQQDDSKKIKRKYNRKFL